MGMWVNKGNSNRDKAYALMALGQGLQGVFGGIGQMVDARAKAKENDRVNKAIKFEQEFLPKQHEAYRQIYNSTAFDETTKNKALNQLVDVELAMRRQFTPEEMLPSRFDLMNTYHNLLSPTPIGMNPRNAVANRTAQNKSYARNQAMIASVPMDEIDKLTYQQLLKDKSAMMTGEILADPEVIKGVDSAIEQMQKKYGPQPEQPSAFSELNRNIAITDNDPYMAGYQTPTEIPDVPQYEPSPEAAMNPLVEKGPGLWDKAKAGLGKVKSVVDAANPFTALRNLTQEDMPTGTMSALPSKNDPVYNAALQRQMGGAQSVAKPLTDEILEEYLNMYNGDIDQAELALIRDGYGE